MTFDREQLEFLMSQAIDGQLSAEDTERLERVLAEDPDARAEFERMQRLDGLLGRWGRHTEPVQEDKTEQALASRVHDDVEFTISRMFDGEEEAVEELKVFGQRDPQIGLIEHKYRRLELLLRGWGSLEPPVDHFKLHARLCEMIHAEAARRRRHGFAGRILRLYTPLAAAASLLLVAGLWWFGRGAAAPSSSAKHLAGPARIEVALAGPRHAAPAARPVMKFSFGVAPDAPMQADRASGGGGSGAILSFGGIRANAATARSADEAIF